MGVVTVLELENCAGKRASSSGQNDSDKVQVPDEEASAVDFMPAESISAVLITPHRILVTGGSWEIGDRVRVLPFTVLRFLDLDPTVDPSESFSWTKPVCLRPVGSSRRRRRPNTETPFPVCRMDQSMTLVPDNGFLYLIGGLKVGGSDEGNPCKSIFYLDPRRNEWVIVEKEKRAVVKVDRDSMFGPRFAHSACYVPSISDGGNRSRSRAGGFIVAYGGFSATDDYAPRSDVHVFDVRKAQWSIRPPRTQGAIEPPALAYHAAAISPSGRYLVVHGGNCADLLDANNISPVLYTFDLRTFTWHEPALHPSSAPPPPALRRHCMVQGVGRHEGSLVLFGGMINTGENSNELYVFRLLEERSSERGSERSSANTAPTVIWEKMDLRSSVHRPTSDDPQHMSEKMLSERTSVSGGCLVPIPSIGKYVLVGGRAAYGIRESPLLLDANDSPDIGELDASESKLPQGTVAINAKDKKASAGSINPESMQTASPPRSGSEVEVAEAANLSSSRNESSIKNGPNMASPPNISSLQPSLSEKSQNPAQGEQTERVTSPRTRKSRADASASAVPSSKVKNAEVVDLESQRATNDERDALNINDDVTLRRHRNARNSQSIQENAPKRNRAEDSDFEERPAPPKRARSTRKSRKAEQDSPETQTRNDDSEVEEVTKDMSCASEFVTSSEHARKGRGRGRGGKTRGRGRGRARGRAAASAATSDDVPEVERPKSDVADSALVMNLREECERLKRDKAKVDEDNRNLNEELLKTVEELRVLRTSAEQLQTRANGFATPSSSPETVNRVRSSRRKDDIPPPALASEASRDGLTDGNIRSEELQNLRAKHTELIEQHKDISAEKENLSKSMEELEEEHRDVMAQLNEVKNKLERMTIDCGSFRKLADEHRKTCESVSEKEQEARKQLRRLEEDNLMMKRDMESLKQEILEEKDRYRDQGRERESQNRKLKDMQDELAEWKQNHEQFESLRRRLEKALGTEQEKQKEVQTLLDKKCAELQKVEDRNVELAADAERSKSELEKRIQDCDAAMKEADQLRVTLETERKGSTSSGLEHVRLQRELERSRKECGVMRERLAKNDGTLKLLLPTLSHATKEIGTILARSEDEMMGCVVGGGVEVTDNAHAKGGKKGWEKEKDVDRNDMIEGTGGANKKIIAASGRQDDGPLEVAAMGNVVGTANGTRTEAVNGRGDGAMEMRALAAERTSMEDDENDEVDEP